MSFFGSRSKTGDSSTALMTIGTSIHHLELIENLFNLSHHCQPQNAMNHEYIHTFRWLRDDYTRLRDGTELFERINECSANTECRSQGSSTEQQNLSSLKSHDYPITSKSTGGLGTFSSSDSLKIAQDKANNECSDNSTIQGESRRPRKGHKKSRRGCYNCKKRKVKVYSIFLYFIPIFLISTVSRNSTIMSELYKESSFLLLSQTSIDKTPEASPNSRLKSSTSCESTSYAHGIFVG